MERHMLSRFSAAISSDPHAAASDASIISQDRTYLLRYIPFEHVNRSARLTIVGITPGNTQITAAYSAARSLLQRGISQADILAEVIKLGAFQGVMRTNLIKVLRHFQVGRKLGISDEATLWGESAHLLHSTSVVPHAAFKNGKMFNGKFSEILQSQVLRRCFEICFVPTLAELPADCGFLALGETPYEALKWCVSEGHIAEHQLLGACPHPSGSSGSAVPYFIREKQLNQMVAGDPVRGRVPKLDLFYDDLSRRLACWAPS